MLSAACATRHSPPQRSKRHVRRHSAAAGSGPRCETTERDSEDILSARTDGASRPVMMAPRAGTCGAVPGIAALLPIVCTDARGMRDGLADGRNAIFVPPKDRAAIRVAVLRLLDNRRLAEKLTSRSARLIKACASVRVVGAHDSAFRCPQRVPSLGLER
jgi:hypothetical protein